MASAFGEQGPGIFKRSLLARIDNPLTLFLPRYKAGPLRTAIESMLGDAAGKRLGEIETPLLVTAVEFNRGIAKVFATARSPSRETIST